MADCSTHFWHSQKKYEWMLSLPNLLDDFSKTPPYNPLVRISESWSSRATNEVQIRPLPSFFFMKCMVITLHKIICNIDVDMLPQWNLIKYFHSFFKLFRMVFSQKNLQIPIHKSKLCLCVGSSYNIFLGQLHTYHQIYIYKTTNLLHQFFKLLSIY